MRVETLAKAKRVFERLDVLFATDPGVAALVDHLKRHHAGDSKVAIRVARDLVLGATGFRQSFSKGISVDPYGRTYRRSFVPVTVEDVEAMRLSEEDLDAGLTEALDALVNFNRTITGKLDWLTITTGKYSVSDSI